ncbi:hypothetical protein GMOD_00001001 [Pyrenophora seminiperda CCB06]|uniref:Uncharacterized protein n=1 Tax=Pyrenophora seminiperda CCB06 TaxID=1302712 RepID=A0A3M7LYB7_9PLEO|nr:hypothetical protein GMOD_00001001 [Pyrenophora seminiperda CCB06]
MKLDKRDCASVWYAAGTDKRLSVVDRFEGPSQDAALELRLLLGRWCQSGVVG